MITSGIDIGKNSHVISVIDQDTGVPLVKPTSFTNNFEGFKKLDKILEPYSEKNLRVGMEDTGHYHFNLLHHLLKEGYSTYLINPSKTDAERKLTGNITKNDQQDSMQIADILAYPARKKLYRKVDMAFFSMDEQKSLTRLHADLTEQLCPIGNKIQKSLDILFPEYNSLFGGHYGKTYMKILMTFKSAANIAEADISDIKEAMKHNGRGRGVSFTAEDLQALARNSVAQANKGEEYALEARLNQYTVVAEQLKKVDKKIEELSKETNSPMLTIPGISHLSCTTILAEIRCIGNFNSAAKLTKFAGVAPKHYESSQFDAKHCSISKKGNKYLRKILYQIITPVINNNKVFKDYYDKKISEGKSHRCAQGHCVRKLLRIIFHILATGEGFDPDKLK